MALDAIKPTRTLGLNDFCNAMTMRRPISSAPSENVSQPPAKRADFQTEDDKAMLRAARELTKDLGEAKSRIYWPDMLVSCGLGYGGIAVAIMTDNVNYE